MQTLIPWIPDAQDQAGPLYPWDHWATVGTGPLGALDHRGYWATGGTGPLYPLGPQWALYPPSGYSGLGLRQAGLPSVPLSYRLHPPCPHTLDWGLHGTGTRATYKHDFNGERWVSGGAEGRREERGLVLPEYLIFNKFPLKIQSSSVFFSSFTLMYFFLI